MRAIIVDDELNSLQNLEQKISEFCTRVELVGAFQKPEEAILEINSLKPDLLFLDIEMPRINGFKLLDQLSDFHGEVIFTTAFGHYAIDAFKVAAFDYLVKPISISELQDSIDRLSLRSITKAKQRFRILSDTLTKNGKIDKIAVPNNHEVEIIGLSDIIRVEGDGNYSKIVLLDGTSILITKILKEFEDILTPYHFYRVHNSHLININHIKRYIKADGGQIEMSNNDLIEISRRKRHEFLEILMERSLFLK